MSKFESKKSFKLPGKELRVISETKRVTVRRGN
jgi:hypothetical protein